MNKFLSGVSFFCGLLVTIILSIWCTAAEMGTMKANTPVGLTLVILGCISFGLSFYIFSKED